MKRMVSLKKDPRLSFRIVLSCNDDSVIYCFFAISVRKEEVAEITPTRVTQGATYGNNEETHGPANAFDKDLITGALATKLYGVCWIKIKLSNTHFVHKILIYCAFYKNWYFPNNWCGKSVNNFKACVDVENNVDVSVYRGDAKQKSCGTLKLTYGLEQSDQIYTLVCGIEGDTVKLSKTSGSRISAYEIVITGAGTLLKSLTLSSASLDVDNSVLQQRPA
jgi:hypothetical protein